MNRFLLSILITCFIASVAYTQDSTKKEIENKNKNKEQVKTQEAKQHSQQFVDNDGDGFNDNAPDHDGDGIPNGLDPDWKKHQENKFVDLDGDGINDNLFQEQGKQKRHQIGPNKTGKQAQGTPQTNSPEQQKQQRKGKQGEK